MKAGDTFLLTLPEVLTRLRCGRTWLMGHLKNYPTYAGGPTHIPSLRGMAASGPGRGARA
ncbi:hypothetical protein [Roseococcus sp.]|uniref:hypothetical protein n=1 Tax=Roseococcus sp. TaxID=2109646 RepID=UPI003BA8AF78